PSRWTRTTRAASLRVTTTIGGATATVGRRTAWTADAPGTTQRRRLASRAAVTATYSHRTSARRVSTGRQVATRRWRGTRAETRTYRASFSTVARLYRQTSIRRARSWCSARPR